MDMQVYTVQSDWSLQTEGHDSITIKSLQTNFIVDASDNNIVDAAGNFLVVYVQGVESVKSWVVHTVPSDFEVNSA